MNKSAINLLLSLPLLAVLAACGGTTEQNVAGNAVEETKQQADDAMKDGAQTSTPGSSGESMGDANSETRRNQLDNDIRAREQRSNTTGAVSDGDIESKVRSKLEANLQKRALTVTAVEGIVTIQGKVANQSEVEKAMRLTREINGVKDVRSELTMGAS